MASERFPELSVVVLAFNEAANLADVVSEAVDFVSGAVKEWELILLNDGSTDGTGELCARLAAEHPRISALHHEQNRGMGAGLRTAYGHAQRQWVTFLPADGQVAPSALAAYFPLTEVAELVTGRYESRGDGPLRWVLSRGLRGLVFLLTGSRVHNEAPYLFRRGLWAEHRCQSESFFLNLEFVIRCERAGVPTATALSRVRPRLSGRSKVTGLGKIAMVFRELIKLRLGGLPPRAKSADSASTGRTQLENE